MLKPLLYSIINKDYNRLQLLLKLNKLTLNELLKLIIYFNKIINYYSKYYKSLIILINYYNNKLYYINNILYGYNFKKRLLIKYLLNYFDNYYILINFNEFLNIINN